MAIFVAFHFKIFEKGAKCICFAIISMIQEIQQWYAKSSKNEILLPKAIPQP